MGNSLKNLASLDQKTPGQVYLCQISSNVSCGACCGLYNIKNPSEENLKNILQRRTSIFRDTLRTETAIDEFAVFVAGTESRYRPLESFHHCPFLGFPDKNNPAVGCMLHPLADGNNGVDYRGLSYYGGYACRSYFCPTVHQLSAECKKTLRLAAPNWYLYGLLITEVELLRRFFEIVESRLGKPVDAESVRKSSKAIKAIKKLFYLKTAWPFRTDEENALANNVFQDQAYEFTWDSIDYHKLNLEPSIWTPVFHALHSEFASAENVINAEMQLDGLVDQLIHGLTECDTKAKKNL